MCTSGSHGCRTVAAAAQVDMLVGDIYGGRDYSNIGLSANTIASSFGKVISQVRGNWRLPGCSCCSCCSCCCCCSRHRLAKSAPAAQTLKAKSLAPRTDASHHTTLPAAVLLPPLALPHHHLLHHARACCWCPQDKPPEAYDPADICMALCRMVRTQDQPADRQWSAMDAGTRWGSAALR